MFFKGINLIREIKEKKQGQVGEKIFSKVMVMCVSLAVLNGLIFSYLIFPKLPEPLRVTDADGLGTLARNLYEGRGYVSGSEPNIYREPLYPLFVAGIYFLFGPKLWAVQLFHSLLHAFTCLLIFFIARQVFKKKIAIFSAFIFAFYPYTIWYMPRIALSTLFTFLIALTLWYIVKSFKEPDWKNGAITGILIGLASLAKSVTILFPLAFLILLMVTHWERRIDVIKYFCVLFFALTIVMAPWTARNYFVSGYFMPVASRAGFIFFHGKWFVKWDPNFIPRKDLSELDPKAAQRLKEMRKELGQDMNDIEWEIYLTKLALQDVLSNPLEVLHQIIWSIPRFWFLAYSKTKMLLTMIMQSFFLIPATIGIFFSLRNKKKDTIPILLFCIYFMVVYLSFEAVAGYAIPIMPYVIMFAVYGSFSIIDMARNFSKITDSD